MAETSDTCARTRPILGQKWRLNSLQLHLVTFSGYALAPELVQLQLNNLTELNALFSCIVEKVSALGEGERQQVSNDYLAENKCFLYLMKETSGKILVLLNNNDNFYNLNAWPIAPWQPSETPMEEIIHIQPQPSLLIAYHNEHTADSASKLDNPLPAEELSPQNKPSPSL